QGLSIAHGSPLGPEEVAAMRKALDWPHAPFEVPDAIAANWRSAGRRGADARAAWEARLAASPTKSEFERRISGQLREDVRGAVETALAALVANPAAIPVRQGSLNATAVLSAVMPELVGGS